MGTFFVEPVTIAKEITFGAIERDAELITFNLHVTKLGPELEDRTPISMPIIIPCIVPRTDGVDGLIKYFELSFRTFSHWFGPISQMKIVESVNDFLRTSEICDLAGDRPYLADMIVMGHC